MAKEIINIGTTANDGTGDPLRNAMTKVNDNFTELYNVAGWGNYADSEAVTATQTITTTPSILLIDGLGASSESGYLPREIRGVSELWDGVDSITPVNIGDAYDIRFTLEITAKTSNPTEIEAVLDIGGASGITIEVARHQIPVLTTPTFTITGAIPIFTMQDFITNGGRLFLATDAGSLTIASRAIFIKRDFSGLL
tara:strand:- start:1765 stop:2355 length:591 start_codon:yes stop_codon:yes gene_type:complete